MRSEWPREWGSRLKPALIRAASWCVLIALSALLVSSIASVAQGRFSPGRATFLCGVLSVGVLLAAFPIAALRPIRRRRPRTRTISGGIDIEAPIRLESSKVIWRWAPLVLFLSTISAGAGAIWAALHEDGPIGLAILFGAILILAIFGAIATLASPAQDLEIDVQGISIGRTRIDWNYLQVIRPAVYNMHRVIEIEEASANPKDGKPKTLRIFPVRYGVDSETLLVVLQHLAIYPDFRTSFTAAKKDATDFLTRKSR